MSALEKIYNLWDKICLKLDPEQINQLMGLTEIEYNFDFDNYKLISQYNNLASDTIIRNILKNINAKKDFPFITDILWGRAYFKIDIIELYLFGLFDFYVVQIFQPDLNTKYAEDPLFYEKALLSYINTSLTQDSLTELEKQYKIELDAIIKMEETKLKNPEYKWMFPEKIWVTDELDDDDLYAMGKEKLIRDMYLSDRILYFQYTNKIIYKLFIDTYLTFLYEGRDFKYSRDFLRAFLEKNSHKHRETRLKLENIKKDQIETFNQKGKTFNYPIFTLDEENAFNIAHKNSRFHLLKNINEIKDSVAYQLIKYNIDKIPMFIIDLFCLFDVHDTTLLINLYLIGEDLHLYEYQIPIVEYLIDLEMAQLYPEYFERDKILFNSYCYPTGNQNNTYFILDHFVEGSILISELISGKNYKQLFRVNNLITTTLINNYQILYLMCIDQSKYTFKFSSFSPSMERSLSKYITMVMDSVDSNPHGDLKEIDTFYPEPSK